tara:strand:- start:53 stop:448 length:396 start_codon:yes stop_codon:yes gene_type:complete
MFKKIKIKHLFGIMVLIFLGTYFNFFLNTYLILKNDFNKRMILNHGYCEKEGYGFVKDALNKYNFRKNIRVLNSQNSNYPNIEGYFYKKNQKFIKEYLILVNFNEKQISKYLKNFKIKEKKNKCYLLQLND